MKRLIISLAVLIASTATASGASSPSTLRLKAFFIAPAAFDVECPPGTPATTACIEQDATSRVRGLGRTTLHQVGRIDRSDSSCFHVAVQGTLTAGDEGTISYAGATAPGSCVSPIPPATATISYGITGGTGAFAGASGTGTLVAARFGVNVNYTWSGDLTAPGHSFDTTAPVFAGVGNRTVIVRKRRAHRARVTYKVTATDDVDGAVRADCHPASGSWFRIGRTAVTCTATDKHANPATARFRVTVRRG